MSCRSTGSGAEPVISNADLRGKVASTVVTRDGRSARCLDGSDDEELNCVVGWAGSDVKGITVRDHGHTTGATIQDGRFTAWWPDGDPDGGIVGTLTLHLAHGSTHTVEGDSLLD